MALAPSKIKEDVDGDLDAGFSDETAVSKPAGAVLPPQNEAAPASPPSREGSPSSPPAGVHTGGPAAPAASPSSPPPSPPSAAGRDAQNQHEPDDAPVVITKKTLDRLLATADGQVQLRAEIARLNGTVGSYKKILDDVAKGGGIVDIDESDPDWKQFAVDFPEIAKGTKRGLELAAKKIGAKVPAGSTETDVRKVIAERVLVLETEALEDEFPNWRTLIGDHPEAKTEFRTWLAKQPKEYNDRVQNTASSAVISRAIRKFEASKRSTVPAPPTARPVARVPAAPHSGGVRQAVGRATRQDRLRGAMTPRGAGGGSPTRQNEPDPFEQGFRQG